MFPHAHLAQKQLNPFNISPLALIELGRCDKWKALFVSFLLLQSPKIGPLLCVPLLGIGAMKTKAC